MNKQVETIQKHDDTSRTMKRRGILAAAGAVVAGMVAKQTTQPVVADDQIWTMPYKTTTSASGPLMWITNTDTSLGSAIWVETSGSGSYGVHAKSYADAIDIFDKPVAVYGECTGAFGVGVYGKSVSYYGLHGETDSGIGVVGNVRIGGAGTSNIGVLGLVGGDIFGLPADKPNTIAVYGQNLSTGINGIGVVGQSDLQSGTGVKGISGAGFPIIGIVTGTGNATNTAAGVLGGGTKGPGVQGQSTGGHGLVGTTAATDGHAGLIGNATHTGGIGLMGIAPNYGTQTVGHAGEFYGNVKIFGGSLLAPVMQASVKHQGDGSFRALHSLATPEGWVEDFGTGTLAADKAEITLDHDFAALIERDYHVFLTAHGPQNLYVTQQTGSGFTVMGMAWATGAGGPKPAVGGGSFSYRVVGKRKDVSGERLAKVAAPTAPTRPMAFEIPKSPDVKPTTTKP